jgi:sugar phosphate isomerase/epimerase
MRLSISNLAWRPEHDDEIFNYLRSEGFSGIECVPGHLPEGFPKYEDEVIDSVFKKYKSEALPLVSMQSVLFGTKNLQLFEGDFARNSLKVHLMNVIDLCSRLGIGNIVFGSPRNRKIPETIDRGSASDEVLPFFKELGDYAFSRGTILSLEPNASVYGTNFLTETIDAFNFVELVGSEGLRLNLDFSTVILNEESPLVVLEKTISLINHIHISEPYLKPLALEDTFPHKEVSNLLKKLKYNKFVSIEMLFQDLQTTKKVISYIGAVYEI